MTFDKWSVKKIYQLTINLDSKRIPLSSIERAKIKGKIPYYGAQGIIDHINNFIFEGSYLLIAEDGANLQTRNEPICLVTKSEEKFWVNNHVHVLESNGECDIKYLMYYLNFNDISGYITGSAQPKLNQANLNNIEINIPKLKTQNNIVAILETLDIKVEINNLINKNLEDLAQTIYKTWFVDFEFPNDQGKPYKSSGGQMIESELGLMPKGWEVLNTDKILVFERGIEPGSKNYSTVAKENFIPFYRVGDLESRNNVYIDKELIKGKIVYEKDVLVSFDGAIGRVGTGFNGSYSTGLRKIYEKNGKLKSSLIYFIMKSDSIQNTIKEHSNGTTILHASTSIPHLKLAYNYEVYKKFELIVDSIFEEIIALKKQSKNLENLRDLLLPKLMSGEIEVKDME